MLTLAAASTIRGVAGTATAITFSIFGMTLEAGVETYSILAQGQLATSTGTLYTVPALNTAFVKQLILANTTGSIVSGLRLYIDGTAAGNQITGTFIIPANGTAMLDDDGLAVYDQNGSLQSAISNQTATNLTGTPALPNGTTATTQSPLDSTTKLATTAYTDLAVAAYGVGRSTVLQVTRDFGIQPKRGGTFSITGTGLTPGDAVYVTMASARPNQTKFDAIEMDQITATGVVIDSTTIQVNWGCKTKVCNQYTFNYWLGN